jgi:hypothetical protein
MLLVPFDGPVPRLSPGGSYEHLRYGPGHETLTGPGRARSTFRLRGGVARLFGGEHRPLLPVGARLRRVGKFPDVPPPRVATNTSLTVTTL